jgi:methionine biosynthesis protein MetW
MCLKLRDRIQVALELMDGGERLLDIGCGAGKLCRLAIGKYQHLWALDKELDTHYKELCEIPINLLRANLDTEQIPLLEETMDTVTCLDVIEHVKDPNFVVEEIGRVLTKNGKLILSVPNIRYWRHLVSLFFRGRFPVTSEEKKEWDGGHLHYFTFKDIRALLSFHHFSIEKERGVFGHDSFLKTITSPGIVVKAKKGIEE